ncbi:DUF2141 domain-containing protein [Pseudoalteromonas sp. MMG013]|uniref:DUF2141 domain-containing protein n=1 Tax=Pseudoalteromonas aurantia 208 TaxID=1314867 RepID=A0ABR9EI93_9GAMM|nr:MULTISPECIES: DUF2141 domain-containing protein [Pseudoalteromonas]MBE0370457.1 hypothetical protein [Pseudoalteromonas aurantia 208]MBQ4845072.1 DUF2141 domain-containing protein [Pseudoalteromonas sp. MMG005]MBQ4863969.1 DUF2141 domain-containing protein [Pseudoalteromonas sp. MMG013]
MFKLPLMALCGLLMLSGCQSTSYKSVNDGNGEPTRLIVNISNVQNTDGQLIVMIHDNSGDYHADLNINDPEAKFYLKKIVTPTMPNTLITFENVPAGQYAINVIHDEDADGGLDRMLFPFTGMPSEPYALSNDVYDNFSKGDFEDALVEIGAPTSQIDLRLATHLKKVVGM